MRPRDEDEERQARAASSIRSPMQAEPSGDEVREENEIVPESSTARRGGSRVPVEDMLKVLITSQIKGPHIYVEEGLLNLLKDCLIAEHPPLISSSLSGSVDHFQSVYDEDLGWGCGWRNIQILCSFLLVEDPESRDALFNGAGFVPDIPALQTWLEIAWAKGYDEPGAEYFNWAIAGTRKWIGTTECAALLRSFGVRAKIVSFTALGGKRVRNDSEYALDGSPIIPSDDDENRASSDISNKGGKMCPGPSNSANSRGGAINSDEFGKIGLVELKDRGLVKNDSHLCDDCMTAASLKGVSLEGGGLPESQGKNQAVEVDTDVRLSPETSEGEGGYTPKDKNLPALNDQQWNFECNGCGTPLRGRRYKSLIERDFDLCSNCMNDYEEGFAGERGLRKNYVIIEEYPAKRLHWPSPENQKEGCWDVVYKGEGGIDHGERCVDMRQDSSLGEVGDAELPHNEDLSDMQTSRGRGGESVDRKESGSDYNQKETALSKPKLCENDAGSKPSREKAGMQGGASSRAENADISHHHLIEWVWSYFTEDSARRFAATSQNMRDSVTMSKRSPLYFQHRGHSRTIVGIERRRKPTGISEDVSLLLLDPSVSTELLVKSLRERSEWQKLVKCDVDSLKEAEYQLCYTDPGIAVGEELEQLKVLSSLRYSYYSR